MPLKSRLVNLVRGILGHYRQHLMTYLVLGIAVVWFGSNFKLAVNVTDSLPGKVYLIAKGVLPQARNEPVAFVWHDPKRQTQYPDGVTFLKLVGGMPGDEITHDGRLISVNEWTLTPKEFAKTGVKLDPNPASGPIPPQSYFVVGMHKDSLDSRYAMVGLVYQKQVIGKAYALF